MIRLTDRPTMTMAIDLGRKATNKQVFYYIFTRVLCWKKEREDVS